MSVEVIFHPKAATRSELSKLLKDLGYSPCGHLWDWPKSSLHYHWFDAGDYRSFDGVEATIYKPSSDKNRLGPCEWALHTRTRSSGSPADKEHQNITIRTARAKFGGNFHNDWYGKNRYTEIGPDPRDATSRGLYLTYTAVTDNIKAVRYSVQTTQESMENLKGTKLEDLGRWDPVRVLYNAIVPFSVAALEGFFSRCFKILLRYNPQTEGKLQQQNRRIELADVIAIKNGIKDLEDVVADWYSFQNIDSMHKAFSDWLGIDFRKIMRVQKKLGRKSYLIEDRLTAIIEFRHEIVHRLELDHHLTKEQMVEILNITLLVIEVFVDFLEAERTQSVRDETVYGLT